MTDVNITYETLYEILRNEKNRDDIQELGPNFYNDVITYLNKNKDMLDEAIAKNAPDDEKEDLLRQVKNIKNLIKEIYERREKKILNIALNKSRTKSDNMEAGMLLPEEKEFYELCVKTFDLFRGKNLNSMLDGNIPESSRQAATQESSLPQQERPAEEPAQENKEEETQEEPKEEQETPANRYVKFKENVPKFLGKELEVYGPFDPEETATLPTELADILIKKGKAEEVREAKT